LEDQGGGKRRGITTVQDSDPGRGSCQNMPCVNATLALGVFQSRKRIESLSKENPDIAAAMLGSAGEASVFIPGERTTGSKIFGYATSAILFMCGEGCIDRFGISLSDSVWLDCSHFCISMLERKMKEQSPQV